MKITKYPQSCLVIEKAGSRILIDPGTIAMQKYKPSDFGQVSAVLYTHQHADHFDESILDELIKSGAKLYANAATCAVAKTTKINLVKDGESFKVGNFQITPVDLAHFELGEGWGDLPQNTGYIIDGAFFHPGDGIDAGDLKIESAAVTLGGPSFDLDDSIRNAKKLQAKRLIPIHYDFFKANPKEFARRFGEDKVIVLADGSQPKSKTWLGGGFRALDHVF